jgi:hypothetical protein
VVITDGHLFPSPDEDAAAILRLLAALSVSGSKTTETEQ